MGESTQERIYAILVEQLGIDEAEVTPQASLVDDLGADSLDAVEVVMSIEEAFGIEIADDEVDTTPSLTVQQIVDLVDKKLAMKKVGNK